MHSVERSGRALADHISHTYMRTTCMHCTSCMHIYTYARAHMPMYAYPHQVARVFVRRQGTGARSALIRLRAEGRQRADQVTLTLGSLMVRMHPCIVSWRHVLHVCAVCALHVCCMCCMCCMCAEEAAGVMEEHIWLLLYAGEHTHTHACTCRHMPAHACTCLHMPAHSLHIACT